MCRGENPQGHRTSKALWVLSPRVSLNFFLGSWTGHLKCLSLTLFTGEKRCWGSINMYVGIPLSWSYITEILVIYSVWVTGQLWVITGSEVTGIGSERGLHEKHEPCWWGNHSQEGFWNGKTWKLRRKMEWTQWVGGFSLPSQCNT